MDVIHFTHCAADPLTAFDSKGALPAARRRPRRCQGRTLYSAFGYRRDPADRRISELTAHPAASRVRNALPARRGPATHLPR